MRRAPHLFLLGLMLTFSVANAELRPAFQRMGNLAIAVVGAAGGNAAIAAGTMGLSRLPATATVVRATLYASQVNHAAGLRARFAGVDLGTVAPAASDSVVQVMYSYAWDVKHLVHPGTIEYSYSISSGNAVAGLALVVIWEDINEPTRIVTLVDGIRQVGELGAETEKVEIQNIGPGATDISIFTVLDDAVNTGETVSYNEAAIGGPIDGNLGTLASLLSLRGESLLGTNTLSISTGTDHMAWMIAAVSVTQPPVPVSATTWSGVKRLFR